MRRRPMSTCRRPYPMSLRHALLAILAVEPLTGYDLTKHFDRSAANVWHAPHSQIYPELRKLESAGLVTAESVARGDHGVKRTYSVSSAGLDVLVEWVEEATPPVPERDDFRLKATYPEYGSFANARRQFEAHLDYHEELRRRWDCLLYTSDAADDLLCVDLGGRRII